MKGKRWERALDHDIEIVTAYADNSYRINGHRDIDYLVDVDQSSCTCPDFKKRGESLTHGCKHVIKVKITDQTPAPVTPVTTPDSNPSSTRRTESDTSWKPSDWEHRRVDVFERDGWTCQSCGVDGGSNTDVELHPHHIKPRADDGTDDPENLLTLCRDCHRKLHGNTPTRPTPPTERGMAVSPDPKYRTESAPEPSSATQHDWNTSSSTIGAEENGNAANDLPDQSDRNESNARNQPTGEETEEDKTSQEEDTVGVRILASLILATPLWLILEAVLFLTGWYPATGPLRFLAVFLPLCLLFLAD